MANSVITQNATGLNPNGGTIISMSNNSVTGNTTDGAFSVDHAATVNRLAHDLSENRYPLFGIMRQHQGSEA